MLFYEIEIRNRLNQLLSTLNYNDKDVALVGFSNTIQKFKKWGLESIEIKLIEMEKIKKKIKKIQTIKTHYIPKKQKEDKNVR